MPAELILPSDSADRRGKRLSRPRLRARETYHKARSIGQMYQPLQRATGIAARARQHLRRRSSNRGKGDVNKPQFARRVLLGPLLAGDGFTSTAQETSAQP